MTLTTPPANSPQRGLQLPLRPGRSLPYGMLVVAVMAQFAAVLISWSTWNLRSDSANLPLLKLPALSFGIPVLATLAASLVWPRCGVVSHAFVVVLACVWDQFRLQPQFISVVVLMLACVFRNGTWFGRWYLVSLWLWSGLHKFLSVEWYGRTSWWYLDRCGFPADDLHFVFSLIIPGAEVALGIAAIVCPRRAAIGCAMLHGGIFLSLSPLFANFNASVWPWNLATAIVGAWILLQQPVVQPQSWWRVVLASLMIMLPAGYYPGWIHGRLSFVVYTGHSPRALYVGEKKLLRLDGWRDGQAVPFPNSPRLFVQEFELRAKRGEKLFIADPRWLLPDRYFLLDSNRRAVEIDRERFFHFDEASGEVRGLEFAMINTVWRLQQAGVKLTYDDQKLIRSAEVKGVKISDHLFADLSRLPNLQELKVDAVNVSDDVWSPIASLRYLEVVDVRECEFGDEALSVVASLRSLRWLHLEQTAITTAGLVSLEPLDQLEVLRLPYNQLGDDSAEHLSRLESLQILDLSHTVVTSHALSHLAGLRNCQWLNLSSTSVDDAGIIDLAALPKLEVVELRDTAVSDAAIGAFQQLKACQLLDVRGTKVTPEGAAKLRAALPDCVIEYP